LVSLVCVYRCQVASSWPYMLVRFRIIDLAEKKSPAVVENSSLAFYTNATRRSLIGAESVVLAAAGGSIIDLFATWGVRGIAGLLTRVWR